MKKLFLLKCAFLALVALAFVCVKFPPRNMYDAYRYDTFNVFHWRDIRFTSAEPNKNFIKTSYILEHPDAFNAFIFGSSRVQYLPQEWLPKESGGKALRWYNMTSSRAIPAEHLQTLRTFLRHGVSIDMVILGFDDIAMYTSASSHKADLMRVPWQLIQENRLKYLLAYLSISTAPEIAAAVDGYNPDEHREESRLFYSYGGARTDLSLTQNPDARRYENDEHIGYSQTLAHKDIAEIAALCREHGIRLVLFTNPIYQSVYRNHAQEGYLDFLEKVAEECEFYNFSGLNAYTKDPRYYYEQFHYRPALGLVIEQMLFGTEAEQAEIRRQAGDGLFGAKINADNARSAIAALRRQLEPAPEAAD